MSKLFYGIKPTDKGVQVRISDPKPQLVRYAGEMVPVEEVFCDLLCSSAKKTHEEKIDEAFRWLERRMQIGQFAGKEATQ